MKLDKKFGGIQFFAPGFGIVVILDKDGNIVYSAESLGGGAPYFASLNGKIVTLERVYKIDSYVLDPYSVTLNSESIVITPDSDSYKTTVQLPYAPTKIAFCTAYDGAYLGHMIEVKQGSTVEADEGYGYLSMSGGGFAIQYFDEIGGGAQL